MIEKSFNINFSVKSWAAFAPGFSTRENWNDWAESPVLPSGCDVPDVKGMPAMARRRLNALGRMVSHVAFATPSQIPNTPIIYASRYGDAERSLGLLRELAADELLSPTTFGLSVHNAVGAMVSIARGDKNNYLAIAGGIASGLSGLVEAAALLADGAVEVVLINYETALPEEYAEFQDEPIAPFAWAWRISAAEQGQQRMGLVGFRADEENQNSEESINLPLGLQMMRCVIRPGFCVSRNVRGFKWELTHHE